MPQKQEMRWLAPVEVEIQSEELVFNVPPLGQPSMEVIAVRLQDVTTGKWYNYDKPNWSEAPKCTAGGRCYIAVWLKNVGTATANAYVEIYEGVIGGVIGVIGYKSETVPAGGGFGVEDEYVQPQGGSHIKIKVTP